MGLGGRQAAYIVPHNKNGLVGPPACVAAFVGCNTSLMSGWGMDMGIPMPGIIWPIGARGAIPPTGTTGTGPAGTREESGMGSLLMKL